MAETSFKIALDHSNKEEFETAWMQALEKEMALAQFVEVVPQMPADWRDRLLPSLLNLLCESLERKGRFDQCVSLVRQLLPLGIQVPDVRPRLVRWIKAMGSNEAWLEAVLGLTQINESRNLTASLEQLDKLLFLSPGRTVDHPSGWGAGLIMDFKDGELIVQFEDGKVREIPLKAARDILRALDPRDIRSRKLADREQLARDVQESPIDVLISVLVRWRGKANATQIKEQLIGSVVPDQLWNRFWKEAKAAAEHHPYVAVEGSSARPVFTLRARPVSLKEEALLALEKAEDEPMLAMRAHRYLASGQEEAVAGVLEYLRAHQERTGHHPELDLILHRHGDTSATDRLRRSLLDNPLHQTLQSLSIPESREVALKAFVDLSEGQWAERLAAALPQLPDDLHDQAIDLLQSSAPERLAKLLTTIMPYPSRTPGLVLKLVRRALQGTFDPGLKPEKLATPLVRLAESVASTPGKLSRESKELLRRTEEMLLEKRNKLFEKFLVAIEDDDLRSFYRLALKLTHFPESLLLKLRDTAEKRLPDTKAKAVPFWEITENIYVTRNGLQRKHDEFRVLTHEKIPQNSANIARALGYGDLSENAEWSAAMEEQRLLTEQATQMKADLDRAKLLEEQDIPDGIVAPGTRITYRIEGRETYPPTSSAHGTCRPRA
ncbi:MAG: hypothetical protein U1E76_09915 [Planctomycetota bacterium]